MSYDFLVLGVEKISGEWNWSKPSDFSLEVRSKESYCGIWEILTEW